MLFLIANLHRYFASGAEKENEGRERQNVLGAGLSLGSWDRPDEKEDEDGKQHA